VKLGFYISEVAVQNMSKNQGKCVVKEMKIFLAVDIK
jgi:hypothetical protein